MVITAHKGGLKEIFSKLQKSTKISTNQTCLRSAKTTPQGNKEETTTRQCQLLPGD